MLSRFRTALMWLLLLALPMQGFAAATMLNCGPNHHRMLAGAAVESAKDDGHAAVGHDQHAMSMTDDRHEKASDGGANDLPSAHHLDKLMKFKCSACAACCVGAALPTAALVIASIPPAMTTAAFVYTPHVDFLSTGLDRPPRLLHV